MVSELYRSAEFAVRSACDFGSDACVITFDSYSDDRSLDRRGFGQDFFASRQIDAVHFISRENDWYQYAEMPAVAAEVAKLVRGHRRVVAYGSSMGAYAAIRFGGLAGATEALAISPQFSIDPRSARFERRWRSDSERIDFSLERALRAPFVDTAYIVYDPRDADRRHADLYRRRTRVVDVRLTDVGHPATGALAELDLLGPMVLDFVDGRLDAEAFARRVLQQRPTSAFFFYVMSTRARLARSRIAYAGRASEMAPGHFGFVAHYASLLAASDRFAEAQIAFARAATIAPDHPVLLYKLTEFHERRGDLERAIEAAELLVSLHSQTFRPRLEHLRGLQARRGAALPWRLTIRGRRIIGDPALAADVRVTTTPSPPPFAESWRLHDALMAACPTDPIDVLLVGDSLAEYWPTDLWAPLRAFNFGVRADRTQHAVWRLEQLAPGSIACKDAVILIGANNLASDDTAAGLAEGIAAVVAAVVRVAPRSRIHVIATPPCGPGLRFRHETRVKANMALTGMQGFETIDVDAALADGANYAEDEIHLSGAGYVRLTELVRARLSAAGADSSG